MDMCLAKLTAQVRARIKFESRLHADRGAQLPGTAQLSTTPYTKSNESSLADWCYYRFMPSDPPNTLQNLRALAA